MIRSYLLCLFFIVCSLSVNAQTMKWVCTPQYDQICNLNDELYLVEKDGKKGIINSEGKILYGVEYDAITPFQEDRALLMRKGASGYNEISAIIAPDGKLIKSLNGLGLISSFDYPFYKEGMLVFVTKKNNRYAFGYLDKSGNVVIPDDYLYAAPFFNGLAVVRMKSGKAEHFGVINRSGRIAVYTDNPPIFLSSFVDNHAIAVVNSRNSNKLVRVRLSKKINEYSLVESEVIAEGYQPSFPKGNYSQLHYSKDIFNFDNALRFIGRPGHTEIDYIALPKYPITNDTMMSFHDEGGMIGIMYDSKEIVLPQFPDIQLLRSDAVAVSDNSGNKGILRLEPSSSVSFIEKDKHFKFIADTQPELSWPLNLKGVDSEDLSVEMRFQGKQIPVMFDAYDSKLRIPYEFIADKADEVKEDFFDATIFVDGIAVLKERLKVSYVYHRNIRTVSASAPKYTDPDGNALISVTVETSAPLSSKAYAIVNMNNGKMSKKVSLGSSEKVTVVFPVTVPEEQSASFLFRITVDDANGPTCHANCSVEVKNYFMQ